jgi:hypothetical protein
VQNLHAQKKTKSIEQQQARAALPQQQQQEHAPAAEGFIRIYQDLIKFAIFDLFRI